MTEKYQRYQKKDWVQWCGRLLKEDSDMLLSISKILVRKDKIPIANKHNILRFALLSLLSTLTKLQKKEREALLKKKKEDQLEKIKMENQVFLDNQKQKLAQIGDNPNVQMPQM